MQTITINVNVPDETAARFAAAPADRINRINRVAAALLPELLADETAAPYDTVDDEEVEPIDMEIIAQLRAADEEAARVGTIPFEEILRFAEADNGPGLVERARVRTAAYKASQAAKTINQTSGATSV